MKRLTTLMMALAVVIIVCGTVFGDSYSGYYRIMSRWSDHCLDVDVSGGDNINGRNVQQWEYIGAEQTNQHWELIKISDPLPPAPTLTVSTLATTVTLSWSAVSQATGYTLLYAPHPYTGANSIGSIDIGTQISVSADVGEGTSFYAAVQGYNSAGSSAYSNIVHFITSSSLRVTPTNLRILTDQTGSCTIGGGTSPYTASSDDVLVAMVSINGNRLDVRGVSEGLAIVTVTDSNAGSVTVSVTVEEDPIDPALPVDPIKKP